MTIDELKELCELCHQIGIETMADLQKFKQQEAQGKNFLKALKDYRQELGEDFKIEN